MKKNKKLKKKGKTTEEALAWLNKTYDTSENVIEQFMADGYSFAFYMGDYYVKCNSYVDFLEMWDVNTGIPCWTCGRHLFRLRGTDYLRCFGLGKWLGEV